MSVSELIEILKTFPEDNVIKVADFDRKGNLVFIDIDPANHIVEYENGFIGIGGY